MTNDFRKRYHYDDFTYDEYRALLQLAKQNYVFRLYDDAIDAAKKSVLWRHDVDMSMHSALRIARIEAEENIKATYFLLPSSSFYNLFESEITKIVREIAKLGHSFGLHFDAAKHQVADEEQLRTHLIREQRLLEEHFHLNIASFSFHNPDERSLTFDAPTYNGLVNCYSHAFRNHVAYCSDSNGQWRHQRLRDVLTAAEPAELQVLTHPEWWGSSPISPRARVFSAIDGRARKTFTAYNAALAAYGRENVFELSDLFAELEHSLGEQAALTLQTLWLRGEHATCVLALWRIVATAGEQRGLSSAYETCLALLAGKDVETITLTSCMTLMSRHLATRMHH